MPPGLALTQGPAKYHVGKPKDNKNSAFFSGCKSRANWNDFITTEKNGEITKIERVFESIAVLPQDIVGGVNRSFYVPTDIYALYWPYESKPQTTGACSILQLSQEWKHNP